MSIRLCVCVTTASRMAAPRKRASHFCPCNLLKKLLCTVHALSFLCRLVSGLKFNSMLNNWNLYYILNTVKYRQSHFIDTLPCSLFITTDRLNGPNPSVSYVGEIQCRVNDHITMIQRLS